MDLELKGKVVLITGAGQGIGKGIAEFLATEGARVAVNEVYQERAVAVAEGIAALGGTALGIRADVTELPGVKAMVETVTEHLGPVDILVNNAGVPVDIREGKLKRSSFAESSPDFWKKQIDLNIYGCLNCTHSVLPSMIKRRDGKIVNIISEAGRIGQEDLALYATAKAGILGFTKSIAREVGPYRINANCVAVGAVAHEGTRPRFDPDATPETDPTLAKFLKGYPIGKGLGRIGRVNDIAYAVGYLASPKACFITGQCLSVSGGFTMIS